LKNTLLCFLGVYLQITFHILDIGVEFCSGGGECVIDLILMDVVFLYMFSL
jgi:hypothetical protein